MPVSTRVTLPPHWADYKLVKLLFPRFAASIALQDKSSVPEEGAAQKRLRDVFRLDLREADIAPLPRPELVLQTADRR